MSYVFSHTPSFNTVLFLLILYVNKCLCDSIFQSFTMFENNTIQFGSHHSRRSMTVINNHYSCWEAQSLFSGFYQMAKKLSAMNLTHVEVALFCAVVTLLGKLNVFISICNCFVTYFLKKIFIIAYCDTFVSCIVGYLNTEITFQWYTLRNESESVQSAICDFFTWKLNCRKKWLLYDNHEVFTHKY